MIPSRHFASRILWVWLVTALVIPAVLGTLTERAQAQVPATVPAPKLSEAERARKLKERDQMRAEVTRLANAGKPDEAVTAALKELDFTRALMGELHEDVVISLQGLAAQHEAREDWAAGRKVLSEVIANRQRQPDQKDWRLADARRALADLERRATLDPAQRQQLQEANRLMQHGALLRSQGKYAEAVGPFDQALKIRKSVLGEDHPHYATSLNNLAMMYLDMGDPAKAEPLLSQALEINKRVLDENHPDYANSLNNLALLYKAIAEYTKAEPLYRQALEIHKRVLGEDHPAYARSLNNLAGLYQAMAEYAKAEPLLLQALEITKRVLGEDHPAYARSLNNLAGLYQAMAEYAKAEPLLRQALEIHKRVLGQNHPAYATSLNNLAGLYEDMSDPAKAEPLHRQALELRKRVLGDNHPAYAESLNNLAMMYLDMGDPAKAELLCRQSLEIQKRVLGENHPDYATSLNNLASLYRDMGDPAKAELLYRQSLEIKKRVLGENHPAYAESLNNLAMLYLDMGDPSRAEPLLRQALEIHKRVLGENHPAYARNLNNLAGVYEAIGDSTQAAQLLRQALTLEFRWTQEGLNSLGERRRIQLLSLQSQTLFQSLSIVPFVGIKDEELYHHVLAFKGQVEARQDEDRLARDQPELKETLGKLAQARARLARLAFTSPPVGKQQFWRQEIIALRDRKEDLEAELARKSRAFRRVKEARLLGAAEVAASLPRGTVLIDLLDYVHTSQSKERKGRIRQARRLLSFVVRRGQAPILVPLGASGPVEAAVRAWRAALVAGNPGSMQSAALEVGQRIWEPLKPHLEGAATILVSPDGPLTLFPLAALPGNKPGTYLVEDLAIGYVSSAHRLVERLGATADDKPDTAAAGLLAIGGIDYQADPGGTAPNESAPTPGVHVAVNQRSGFKPLAGTGPEARHIGELFGGAFPKQHALILTGAEPTEGAVKQQLGRHMRYLHLATHGFFESPARMAAIRAGLKSEAFGMAGAADSEESAALALAPLLQSGVALAGAGRKSVDATFGPQSSQPDQEDGILTAEEVQSLDLRGTELVVLSACETGLGQGTYGQGVLGLQRAFQAAGARAVAASLWKVDDAATTVLMERFYTNLWEKKMPKLEALRQAQLTVLNNPNLVRERQAKMAKERGISDKSEPVPPGGPSNPPNAASARSHPAHWAAFVLSGDGR